MKETLPIGPEILHSAIKRATLIEAQCKPRLPADIHAVWVFGGPGTYSKPLGENDEPWQKNMDKNRIRAGVKLVYALTVERIKNTGKGKVRPSQVNPEDIARFGPLFVYNGNCQQNGDFRKALEAGRIRLPLAKVIILNQVESAQVNRPITNTHDQIASFYQELARWESPLFRCHRVALVSHSPHFIRIPHYIRQFEEDFLRQHDRVVSFFAFGVKSNQEVFNQFVREELKKLTAYLDCGHLNPASTPHLAIA